MGPDGALKYQQEYLVAAITGTLLFLSILTVLFYYLEWRSAKKGLAQALAEQARKVEAEQKACEEQRQNLQAEMHRERLHALGEMASGIAHDINNALCPLVCYTDLISSQEQNLSPESREYLKSINQCAENIVQIVARVRAFYRRRSVSDRVVELDLNQLVENIVAQSLPQRRDIAQLKGIAIDIQCELDPDLPLFMAEPSEVRESIENLIQNSIQALPKGGSIHLTTRTIAPASAESWSVAFEARDNGIGMDETVRRRCVEPFFSTRSRHGSTGLGLAMVYGTMQRHDGKLEIESKPGAGTCVRLTFPALAPKKVTSDPVCPSPILRTPHPLPEVMVCALSPAK